MPIYNEQQRTDLTSRGKQPFVFTFGFGHSFAYGYVRIWASGWNEARAEMVQRYATAWAFQYMTEDDAGVEEFNLELVNEYEGE